MVKESNKNINKSEKSNNFSIIRYDNTISKSYYFYLNINRFTVDDKEYYRIDYVLNNNKIDLIPDINIFNKNEITSKYTLKYNNKNIYMYKIPNIQLFNYLDLFDYKVKTVIFDIEINENIFIKLFKEKKIYIKNDNKTIEEIKIKNNLDSQLENLTNIFLEKMTIN